MELLNQFERAALAASATFERAPRDAERLAALVLAAAGDARKITIAQPRHLPAELFAACWRLPGTQPSPTKSDLAAADVGVTEAFAGVARTGSVCISLDADLSGYASLLARTHVTVLAEEDIVERPSDLFRPACARGEGLRGNFVFVTGPSATADMGPLVRGVHGPHRLHIILLDRT